MCRTEAVTDCYIHAVKMNDFVGQWMLNYCFVKSNLNRTCKLLLYIYSEVAMLEIYTNPGHS